MKAENNSRSGERSLNDRHNNRTLKSHDTGQTRSVKDLAALYG